MSRTVAVFDVDGTLLQGDCLRIAARRAAAVRGRGPLATLLAALACLPWAIAWRLGLVATARFKERTLAAFGICEALERVAAAGGPPWLLAELQGRLRPEALERLRWHQRQGHRVLLCSASPRPLLAPLAAALGVELLCTELACPGGHWQPRLAGPNCKGPEKVRRLEAHLGALADLELEAYGDSRGDRELLLAAARPHWRSFRPEPVAYPPPRPVLPWVSLLALALLLVGLGGLGLLQPAGLALLASQLRQVLPVLPQLYAILAVAYGLRYLRWRLLLGAAGVGRWSWADGRHWFAGFALTATPAKLGELSRVAGLHQALGYPRRAVAQVFVAERIADAVAVAAVLLVLGAGPLALGWVLPLGLVAAWLGRSRWGRLLPGVAPLLVSMLLWVVEALLLWRLLAALSPVAVPLAAAIRVYLLSGLAGMASQLPAGIGVNEATTVLLLGQLGVPAAVAVPVAVLRRLITPWSVVALAALLGWRDGACRHGG